MGDYFKSDRFKYFNWFREVMWPNPVDWTKYIICLMAPWAIFNYCLALYVEMGEILWNPCGIL